MNWKRTCLILATLIIGFTNVQAQTDKVSHAEPLFFDLVRDLGARKGEKEINIGADFTKGARYNEQAYLIEYEFAPINRLGFEVEADVALFNKKGYYTSDVPQNKWEGIRLSTQYSFFVSTKINTTLAVGYTQIMEFANFINYGKSDFLSGTTYNPYFIAAKRWGARFHTLIYISPLLQQDFESRSWSSKLQLNASVHYVFLRTNHFVGIEVNQEFSKGKMELMVRPQVKLKLTRKLAVGGVLGIPIHKTQAQFSTFLRVIYEL